MIVRSATLEDVDWLLIELKKFSDFFNSKYQLVGPNREHNEFVLKDFITNHLFLVAENGDEKLGFISGYLHKNAFNPEIMQLTETFWWVKPEHRKSLAGAKLFSEFMKYGKKNCQWVLMTLETDSPIKLESLYKRGFKPKEISFIMEN